MVSLARVVDVAAVDELALIDELVALVGDDVELELPQPTRVIPTNTMVVSLDRMARLSGPPGSCNRGEGQRLVYQA